MTCLEFVHSWLKNSESLCLQPMELEQVYSDQDSEDEVDDDIADFEDRRVCFGYHLNYFYFVFPLQGFFLSFF